MQFTIKEYNPEAHDLFKALMVRQPYADYLVTRAGMREGVPVAYKDIEVRRRPTKYRGDILICSTSQPAIPGHEAGVTLGLVELYDVRPAETFTPDEWERTRIPSAQRAHYGGYGWFLRNPRRVIEFPVKGNLGIFNLIFSKDTIIQYPEIVKLDEKL